MPALRDARVSGFLVTALPNIRYLTGFTGSNAGLLITKDRALLFTDPRYQTQAAQECDCEVKIAKGPLIGDVRKWLMRLKLTSVAFEQNRISYRDYSELKEGIKRVRFRALADSVEMLRMRKSPSEIATIRASVKLNSAALEHALRHFHTSMTEIDLAAEIEYRMRQLGADGPAFETIVAAGPRSALPHAHPTGHPIHRDQLLLVDMGAAVAGYASDMTRTYAVGKLDAKIRRMYRAVLESQLAAIDAIKPGISCGGIDRIARGVLQRSGLDKLFLHSTGHGLGLEIHERPRVGRKEHTKLEAGMVITVEPGVYVEGLGGIRIEDTVAVTPRGSDVLTPTGKELIVL
jgi:Xaa-Pro aminopeptidase